MQHVLNSPILRWSEKDVKKKLPIFRFLAYLLPHLHTTRQKSKGQTFVRLNQDFINLKIL